MKLAAAVNDGGGGGPAGKFAIEVAAGAPTGPCTLVLRSGLRLELAALPSPTRGCWPSTKPTLERADAFAALEIIELREYNSVLDEGTRHVEPFALLGMVARKPAREKS